MNKKYNYIKQRISSHLYYGRTFLILSIFAFIIKHFFFLSLTIETGNDYFAFFLSDCIIIGIISCLVVLNIIIGSTKENTIKNAIKGTREDTIKNAIKILINTIIIIIFTLFVGDSFIFFFSQSRISPINILQFINKGTLSFLGTIIRNISITLILILITFIAFPYPLKEKERKKKIQKYTKIGKFILLWNLIFFLSYFIIIFYHIGNIKYQENILFLSIKDFYNQILGNDNTLNDVSKTWINPKEEYEKYFKYTKGENKKPNIILVFAESFSLVDSLKNGGIHNNLPYFDRLQEKGIQYTNFISNGTTSDSAHVGVLQGNESLTKISSKVSHYFRYKSFTEPLPFFLNKQGYLTKFISSVSLDFLEQKKFLINMGFQDIIGSEAFEKEKKYTFNAAPDQFLYKKTLEEINKLWEKKEKAPFFIALQTISSHKPYDTPYWNEEEDAFKYADIQLFKFYLNLKAHNFFDNWLLIIVSDHKKMEAITKEEFKNFGELSTTKIPAVVIWTGIVAWTTNKNITQHTDIFYSLKKLTGTGNIKIPVLHNNIFDNNELNAKRNRGITNSYRYDSNYIISYKDNNAYKFSSLNEIKKKDKKIYNYLNTYRYYQNSNEYSNKKTNEKTNEKINKDKKSKKTFLIGHRWAPNKATDNSLEGFLFAKKMWASGIEFDVSYTKDKKNVVLHGETLATTTCGKKIKIWNINLSDLQKKCKLKNGEPVLELRKMLELIDGLFQYYFLEIKIHNEKDSYEQTKKIIQTVKDLEMQDRVIFITYNKHIRKRLGEQEWIISWRDTFDPNDIKKIKDIKSQYFLLPYSNITPEIVRVAKEEKKEIATYTVNSTWDYKKIKNMGIKFIMTDNIPLLLQEKEEIIK